MVRERGIRTIMECLLGTWKEGDPKPRDWVVLLDRASLFAYIGNPLTYIVRFVVLGRQRLVLIGRKINQA